MSSRGLGLQDRLKRRRIDTATFPTLHKCTEKLTTEDCGACLLPLVDNAEVGYNPEDDLVLIAQPEICAHLFHPNCIKFWARRDTSCPQCRLRFSQLAMYRTNGVLIDVRAVEPVFLSDVIEQEEEGDLWYDDEYDVDDADEPVRGIRIQYDTHLADRPDRPPPRIVEEEAGVNRYNSIDETIRARRQRRRAQRPPDEVVEEPAATVVPGGRRRRPREQDVVAQAIEGRLTEAVLRMREQLAAERRREVLELERIRQNIDTEMVKLTVLRNLKRLPYNFAVPDGDGPLDTILQARSQPSSFDGTRAPRRRVSSAARARVAEEEREREARRNPPDDQQVPAVPAVSADPRIDVFHRRWASQETPLPMSPKPLQCQSTRATPDASHQSPDKGDEDHNVHSPSPHHSSAASPSFIHSYDKERRARMVVPSASPAANTSWGSQFSRFRRPARYQHDFLVTGQDRTEVETGSGTRPAATNG